MIVIQTERQNNKHVQFPYTFLENKYTPSANMYTADFGETYFVQLYIFFYRSVQIGISFIIK
jgi:hypothetical protein